MKSLEEVIIGYKSETLDGRDLSRLSQFVPEDKLKDIGVTLKDEFAGKHVPTDYTRENVLAQLEKDVDFGFEKALNRRGISASLMYSVVSMWNWILEEGLEDFDDYPQYGLPLFKATAVKYGFTNPIGNDTGAEEEGCWHDLRSDGGCSQSLDQWISLLHEHEVHLEEYRRFVAKYHALTEAVKGV